MLSDQNKALVLRVSGNVLTGSDAEWSNLEQLLDAAREEGRQSAGDRVKALEDELRRHTEHLADFDRRYSMDSSSDVAAALYCAQRLLSPQAAPVEQGEGGEKVVALTQAEIDALLKDANLYNYMLHVAKANGFDSITDAIAKAVKSAGIMDALTGFDDDYQTSEHHHPNHVLIPTAKFEAIRAAQAAIPISSTKANEQCPICRKPVLAGESRATGYFGGEGDGMEDAHDRCASPDVAKPLEWFWSQMLEVDDRNSPEEYPEMILITYDEMKQAMQHAVQASLANDQKDGAS